MSTYMVTGAAGFIASKVCEQLLEKGHTVIGVDNMNDAYDVRLKEWRLERLMKLDRFEFVRCDINDRDRLRPLFARGLEAVVNLAARAGVRQSVENPWVYMETNVTGTVTLLELCREYRCAQVSCWPPRRVCTERTTRARSGKMRTRTVLFPRTQLLKRGPKRSATPIIICMGSTSQSHAILQSTALPDVPT